MIEKVQKVQNFAIKIADEKAKKFDHVTPLFEELKLIRMKKLITFSFLTAIFKHRIKTYPDHILPLTTISTMTLLTTEQQNYLYVLRTHTHIRARAKFVLEPYLWKDLKK